MKLNKLAIGVAVALLTVNTAHAEIFGLLNGRSADPSALPDLSVEAGVQFGDFQNFGARVNYKLNESVVVFGDFGLSEFGVLDGTTFGFGAFFHLADQRFLENADMAAKASYHRGTFDFDGFGGNFDFDLSNISLEVLFSGKEPLSDNGMKWYANGGLNLLDTDDFGSGSTEILLGGGVFLPVGTNGEAYAGIDFVDEIAFGAGFRYFVQ